MADNRTYIGMAKAETQLTSVTVGGTLAGETFQILVNGIVIAEHTDVTTVIDDTVAALVAAWIASTHPYAVGIAAVDANPDVELTGLAGLPFTLELNVPGGAATLAQVETETATGPNYFSNADNWSGNVVPITGDSVFLGKNAISLCHDLEQSAITLALLVVEQNYTGRVGLNSRAVAQSADGGTADPNAAEYRPIYLEIGATNVRLGQHDGPSAPSGSGRMCIDLGAAASTVEVFNTAAVPAELGLPAVRLLTANAATDLYVRKAPGGVGVAVDAAGETSTIGSVVISDIGTNSKVTLSDGVTLSDYKQTGGDNVLRAAADFATAAVDGGVLTIEGDYKITTLTERGGVVNDNHIKTAGDPIGTVDLEGGLLDTLGSGVIRGYTTVNMSPGATLRADEEVLTIGTLNITPDGGPYTLALS